MCVCERCLPDCLPVSLGTAPHIHSHGETLFQSRKFMVLMNFSGQVGLKKCFQFSLLYQGDRQLKFLQEIHVERDDPTSWKSGRDHHHQFNAHHLTLKFQGEAKGTQSPPVRVISSAVGGEKKSPQRIMDSAINHKSSTLAHTSQPHPHTHTRTVNTHHRRPH